MKEKFYRFMYGRNGVDNLSRFLTFVALALVVLQLILGNFIPTVASVFWYLAIIILVYAYVRIFSKNLNKRRTENSKFLRLKGRIVSFFKNKKERTAQRHDYSFFKCPSCKAMLRVPKRKGKVRITCRKCGTAFERKT